MESRMAAEGGWLGVEGLRQKDKDLMDVDINVVTAGGGRGGGV